MLTDAEKQDLVDVVVQNTFQDQFESMVRDRLQKTPGKNTESSDFRDVVTTTVETAIAEKWLKMLLALLVFMLKVRSPVGKVAGPLLYKYFGATGLQTLIDGSDTYEWEYNAERMREISKQVCRLEIKGNPSGTGVLVGEDCVLTSYHVIKDLMNGVNAKDNTAGDLKCRFDYAIVKGPNGGRVVKDGVVVDVSDPWLELHSAAHQDELQLRTAPPAAGPVTEFDYALVKLSQKVGQQRGWVALRKPVTPPELFDVVRIAQFPRGQPLKGADGRLTTFPPNLARIQYSASSDPGSSGGPCLNEDFDLIAIHNLGGVSSDAERGLENQGVPIGRIVEHIVQQGGALPPAPPQRAAAPAVAHPSANRLWSLGGDYPVLNRRTLQESLHALLDPAGGQLLLVKGENPGYTFSTEIAQRMLGALGHVVVVRSAVSLMSATPEQLNAQLRTVLKLKEPQPRVGAIYSTRASQINRHLVDLILGELRDKFPVTTDKTVLVWLLFDALDQAKLPEETHDFLIALMEQMPQVPTLRVVLIGYTRELPGAVARIALEDDIPTITEADVEEYLLNTCEMTGFAMPAAKIKALAGDVVTVAEKDALTAIEARIAAEGKEPPKGKAAALANERLTLIGKKVQKLTRTIKARGQPEVGNG